MAATPSPFLTPISTPVVVPLSTNRQNGQRNQQNRDSARERGESGRGGRGGRRGGRNRPQNSQPTDSSQPRDSAPQSSPLPATTGPHLTLHPSTSTSQSQYTFFSGGPSSSSSRPPQRHSRPLTARQLQSIEIDNLDEYPELSQKIIQKIKSNSLECLVCCEDIPSHAAVWTCGRCYAILHLRCINQWRTHSVGTSAASTAAAAADQSEESEGPVTFRCPHCQHNHTNVRLAYSCFCGKVHRPQTDPYMLPHSCGQACLRPREGTQCPHKCTLRCHPGPCPPCSALSPPKHCHCGKLTYRTRCSDVEPIKSCGVVCGKTLSCGSHKCTKICHEGPCDPCSETLRQTCYCGKITDDSRVCQIGVKYEKKMSDGRIELVTFSCKSPCSKPFNCGNHECARVCHPFDCGECERSPEKITHCPCGKQPIPPELRTSCADPIPTCMGTCGKLLPCGKHKCLSMCHDGPCPDCKQQVTVSCACGLSPNKSLPCFIACKAEYQCQRVCKASKNCGKHKCNTKCCPSANDPSDRRGLHICVLRCGKKLTCGAHDCEQLCHPGKCPSCLNVITSPVSCTCGQTVLQPPLPCGTARPKCQQPCSIPRPCGHPPGHQCHVGPCSPCGVPVEKMCVGGHTTLKNIPCHLSNVMCDKPCKKLLPCGIHECERKCHTGACKEDPALRVLAGAEPKKATAAAGVTTCWQKCGKKMKCRHPCTAKCHGATKCPMTACKAKVQVTCACGRRTQDMECCKIFEATQLQQSGGSEGESGEGESSIPKSGGKFVLPCDAECAREQRNRAFREAAGVEEARSPVTIPFADPLRDFARSDPRFAEKVERDFETLIKSKTQKSHSFEPMNRDKRAFIHGLASYYRLDTQAYDVEPKRNVVATKNQYSAIPMTILTKSLHSAKPEGSAAGGSSASQQQPLDESNAILFDQLDNAIKTSHIDQALSKFRGTYFPYWLNDTQCLVIFGNQIAKDSALRHLASATRFVVSDWRAPIPPKPAKPVVAPPAEKKPDTFVDPSFMLTQGGGAYGSSFSDLSLRPRQASPPKAEGKRRVAVSAEPDAPTEVPDSWDEN